MNSPGAIAIEIYLPRSVVDNPMDLYARVVAAVEKSVPAIGKRASGFVSLPYLPEIKPLAKPLDLSK